MAKIQITDRTPSRSIAVPDLAVIGAGISGLLAARTLQDQGVKVTVFEKSRGVGGRMSTRRMECGSTFDHGAQYFTARDQRFIGQVRAWVAQGLVAKWPDRKLGNDQEIVVINNGTIKSEPNVEARFVAVPTMNAICRMLAENLPLHTQTRVAKVKRGRDGIELFDIAANSLGTFDRLIVTAPAAQSAELLESFPAVAKPIATVKMTPCWATMVAFQEPVTDQWVGAFFQDSFLSWVARNSTKPGRNHDIEQLIMHAIPDWTAMHWEHDAGEISQMMLAEFWRATGILPKPVIQLQSHRWKYANPVAALDQRFLADESEVLFAGGDWVSGARVEGAFISGMSIAERILETLPPSADCGQGTTSC